MKQFLKIKFDFLSKGKVKKRDFLKKIIVLISLKKIIYKKHYCPGDDDQKMGIKLALWKRDFFDM